MKYGFLGCVLIAFSLLAIPTVHAEGISKIQDVVGGFRNAEGGGTEVGFIIGGAFAKNMWNSMRSQAKPDVCTGGTIKTDRSGMTCARDTDGSVQCSFGYNFNTQKLNAGPLVC